MAGYYSATQQHDRRRSTGLVLHRRLQGETLAQYIRHPYIEPRQRDAANLADSEPHDFRTVLSLLRAHTDYDFKSYKKGTLERRIHRRMGLKQVSSLNAYVEHLRENPEELSHLFKDLLIGVTRFFREGESWEQFANDAIRPLIERKGPGMPLRAWVPGCASGEEAYTLAIMIFDRLDYVRKPLDVQIFATDLSQDAITAARSAAYPKSIAADVPEDKLKKFFVEEDEHYRVAKRLREAVVFAQQNVISDPPFSKLDIITCRNLMIYLEHDIQQRMIEMFHFALADEGFLFLGSSETAERPGRMFTPISKTHRIYRRAKTTKIRHGSFPILASRERSMAQEDGESPGAQYVTSTELAKRALLNRFVPASVLVNRRLEAQYFHGPVRNYLDFPAGEPTSELPMMALEGLRSKLRGVLNKVMSEREAAEATARNVRRNGHEVSVRISAEPVAHPGGGEPHILVYFEDVSKPRDHQTAETERAEARATASPEESTLVGQLEYELQATKEDLQSTIEEMETANEELKASNEEVMSMNEELQSTNEELETSREELQSLNEELSTVNNQLEDKVTEVEASNNDLSNLLKSTDIATVFLDTDLRIRRFTPATKEILRVIDSDIGRPIDDLAPRFNDPDLISDAAHVLEKLQPRETEVQGRDNTFYIRRILPYRTSDNKIEGVVVTLTDVTKIRHAVSYATQREKQQEAVAELGRLALADQPLDELFDKSVRAVATNLNLRFAKLLELRRSEDTFVLRTGIGWRDGLVGTARVGIGSISQAGYTLERSTAVVVEDFATERRFKAPELLIDHKITCGASVIIGPLSDPWGILGAHDTEIGRCEFSVDDTNFMQSVANILWLAISQQRASAQAEEERLELRQLTDSLPMQIAVVGPDERYIFNNAAYGEWNRDLGQLKNAPVGDLLGPEAYARAKPHIDRVLSGATERFELQVEMPGKDSRTNLVTYTPRKNSEGQQTGFYSIALDITDRKRKERRLELVTAELDHRVKNILATVASVTRHTARKANDIESFTTALQSRIEALARAHNALAEDDWNGMSLASLLGDELRAYGDSMADRIELAGPDIMLTAQAVQPMALAIHELATNAAKYGALQASDGRLSVRWSIKSKSAPVLAIDWDETGLEALDMPKRKGFGLTMVEEVISAQLGTDVDLDYRPSGLHVRIDLPNACFTRN